MSSHKAKQVQLLADLSWSFLNDSFVSLRSKRPPLYLFLSKESQGSLSKRRPEEIDFIHRIQAGGGGAVLVRRPHIAYVSQLDQVVEETAHLYSLCLQKDDYPESAQERDEFYMSALHESFGAFAQCLLQPRQVKPPHKEKDPLWNRIHQSALYLGKRLAEAYYDEEIQTRQICLWLKMRWNRPESAKQAYLHLMTLCAKKLRQRA